MIILDGSRGEGGGQILRTALTLSMVTGEPFRIDNIRARRAKPGLMRQHLTCVKAAARISSARTKGAELGSQSLTFEPAALQAGVYEFAIGTAGSTGLVLQTVWPALARAGAPSSLSIRGGTHNKASPPFGFLDEAYVPLVRRMGYGLALILVRPGFYPAGGGEIQARITPTEAAIPLILEDAGPCTGRRIEALVANLPFSIGEREATTAASLLNWPTETLRALQVKADGPGNVLTVRLEHEHVTEVFTGFGEQGVTAEAVAKACVEEVRDHLVARVPVGLHLADQLLLPMALAGGGRFLTQHPTSHTRSNIEVIEKFLPVEIAAEEQDAGRFLVRVEK